MNELIRLAVALRSAGTPLKVLHIRPGTAVVEGARLPFEWRCWAGVAARGYANDADDSP